MSITIKDGATAWFTSDHHHMHKNIIEYSGRPWTFEEQTQEMINRWNNRVGVMDHAFHLGDFAFANVKKARKVVEIIEQLNGLIHFVKGNHCDRQLWNYVREANLAHVQFIGDYLEVRIGESRTKVCMFHYPMEVWNGMHHGSIHLHGHCHGSLPAVGKRLDVGLDNHPDFQVFSWAEVSEHMAKQPFVVKDHHDGQRP
ncbi:phosphoesterase [Pseudomonas phage vB_PpuM-NoPa]|uniref:Phosphoesterase n=2 Tax=Tartuvirus TaxID=3424912 RepID=A0AAX4MXK8_9CAUD